MKVQILDTAEQDLVEGYWFYEMQQPGLGAYFLNSINRFALGKISPPACGNGPKTEAQAR